MKKRSIKSRKAARHFISAVLIFSAGLSACGNEPVSTPTPELESAYDSKAESLSIRGDEIISLCAQSGLLPLLESIEISDTVDDAQGLEQLRAAFPQAEIQYQVDVCGQMVSSSQTSLDLSALSSAQVNQAVEALALLPQIERISLSPEKLSLEDVGKFQAAPIAAVVDYTFSIYDRQFNTSDEFMDLNRVRLGDNGAALREVLPYMKCCKSLEMEDCGISNEDMAKLRDDFPNIKVVWRINFGYYSVRTDETRILASIRSHYLSASDVEPLKYCRDVKYLDLGHNIIEDISFVSEMTQLEVAILAINYWADASPLENCQKLEYLEIFNTRCTDLSPLAKLPELKHLNIAWIKGLEDISPLYSMTGLERLWIGCVNQVPQEQMEEIQLRLPDTLINTTTDTPTSEGWRVSERYELLREQMGYDLPQPYSVR